MVQRVIRRANLPLALAAATWSAILYAAASKIIGFPYLPGLWGIIVGAVGVSLLVCLARGRLHELFLLISIPLTAGTTPIVLAALLNGGVLTIVVNALAIGIGLFLGLAWGRVPGKQHGRWFKILASISEALVVALLLYGDLTVPDMQNSASRLIIALSLMTSVAITIEAITRRRFYQER